MELKDFNELELRDFENGAVKDTIRLVFKERDKLRMNIRDKQHTICPLCKGTGRMVGTHDVEEFYPVAEEEYF